MVPVVPHKAPARITKKKPDLFFSVIGSPRHHRPNRQGQGKFIITREKYRLRGIQTLGLI
jgi:hypothetical protein